MNWIKVASVAIKVVAAATVGLAVFVGVDRAVKDSKKGASQPSNANGNFCDQNSHQPSQNPFQDSGQNQNQGVQVQGNEGTNVVVNSLKATMETSSKIMDFAQSLIGVVESAARVFGSNQPSQSYNNHYGGSINMGGQTWTRISPFIIQAGPGNLGGYNNYQNTYPF